MSAPDVKSIGKYRILAEISRGSMGIVYKAFDPVIKRNVAIKTIKKEAKNEEESKQLIERFQREAQAAGRMQHPNIVSIYEYGEHNDTAYIAMEYVEGRELKSFLDDEDEFDIETIIYMMHELLTALKYSHSCDVVHRDIKPANIIIKDSGELKVADFGIARIEDSELTVSGSVLGTPSYMPPEQFKGETADNRSDIYSAGVIFYHLLTGKKPFSGKLTEIMHDVLNVVPPSAHEVNENVPEVLSDIAAKAMSKTPDDRYQTADNFISAMKLAYFKISNKKIVPEKEEKDEEQASLETSLNISEKEIEEIVYRQEETPLEEKTEEKAEETAEEQTFSETSQEAPEKEEEKEKEKEIEQDASPSVSEEEEKEEKTAVKKAEIFTLKEKTEKSTLRFELAEVVLAHNDALLRSSLRDILFGCGFRRIRIASNIKEMEAFLNGVVPPCLVIAGTNFKDGELHKLVKAIRHHEIGGNPFLPVVALVEDPTPVLVRKTINSGTDIMISTPVSLSLMKERINYLIFSRKPFAITKNYIGPDRRNDSRPGDMGFSLTEVPNILRAVVTGEDTDKEAQHKIGSAVVKINHRNFTKNAKRIRWFVKQITPELESGTNSPEIMEKLDQLAFVLNEMIRKIQNNENYSGAMTICHSINKVVVSIKENIKNSKKPEKDIQFLKSFSERVVEEFKNSK